VPDWLAIKKLYDEAVMVIVELKDVDGSAFGRPVVELELRLGVGSGAKLEAPVTTPELLNTPTAPELEGDVSTSVLLDASIMRLVLSSLTIVMVAVSTSTIVLVVSSPTAAVLAVSPPMVLPAELADWITTLDSMGPYVTGMNRNPEAISAVKVVVEVCTTESLNCRGSMVLVADVSKAVATKDGVKGPHVKFPKTETVSWLSDPQVASLPPGKGCRLSATDARTTGLMPQYLGGYSTEVSLSVWHGCHILSLYGSMPGIAGGCAARFAISSGGPSGVTSVCGPFP